MVLSYRTEGEGQHWTLQTDGTENTMNQDVLKQMLTSKVRNYIIPGLNSELLGNGQVRLFTSSREISGFVAPHNHRFDFACYVLSGIVCNRTYLPVSPFEEEIPSDADQFTVRTIMPTRGEGADFGKYDYDIVPDDQGRWFTSDTAMYEAGQWYSMTWDQFHSITFGKNTQVLFFEGPQKNHHSQVLLPYVDGLTIESMTVEDWMFLTNEPDDLEEIVK